MSLEQRLEALEAEIRELRAALERRETSMRRERRCPACGSRRILHAKRVGERSGVALSVAVVGLFAPEARGCFECYVCSACGACEWYVEHPAELEAVDEVVVLAPESEPSPYR